MSGLMEILLPLLLVAGGLFAIAYVRPKMLAHVREMKFMTTTTFGELQNLFGMMQADGLGDTVRHYVEIKGMAHCDAPVRTPFSERDVAYCASTLYAVTQQEEQYRDSSGKIHRRMEKREELLADECSADTLLLKSADSDLRIVLDVASGCKFDVPETFDRFEPMSHLEHYTYFRDFRYRGPNLLGYHMKEKTVSPNQPLYVLGEAYQEGAVIHIGRPHDKEKPFIVSTKSEDEMVGQYETHSKMALLGGIAAIVAGILLLVMHVIG